MVGSSDCAGGGGVQDGVPEKVKLIWNLEDQRKLHRQRAG